jgi:hypothetical protein
LMDCWFKKMMNEKEIDKERRERKNGWSFSCAPFLFFLFFIILIHKIHMWIFLYFLFKKYIADFFEVCGVPRRID